MKPAKMNDLVEEMIAILERNKIIFNKKKANGYSGWDPEYECFQKILSIGRFNLLTFDKFALSKENRSKLEEACEAFCLAHLIHGEQNDEQHLCHLIDTNEPNLLYEKDTTQELAAKYNLGMDYTIMSGFYFKKFDLLFAELQKEISLSKSIPLRTESHQPAFFVPKIKESKVRIDNYINDEEMAESAFGKGSYTARSLAKK